MSIGRALAASAALAVLLCVSAHHAGASVWPRPHVRTAEQRLQRLISLGEPIYCGGLRGREVALTFDDGPGPYTTVALHILRRARDRATFFVVGRLLDRRASLVRRELRVGDVGDHTWSHVDLDLLPPVQVTREIERTTLALRELTRRPVLFFRPPYGAHDAEVDAIVRRLRLLEILWNVDSRDSEGADPAQIAAAVAHARPGSIILMHENRGQTLKGLLWLHALADLRARHLHAVTLTQLLESDPPSRAQLAAGARGCGLQRLSRGG